MAYEIIIKPSAQKDFNRLPDKEVILIASKLELLSKNPRMIGTQKLSDDEGYRISAGQYRVLFVINDREKLINIYRIKHRKDAYC